MSHYEAVVAGHLCLDMTPRFQEDYTGNLSNLMRPGKLNYVGPLVMSTGGAVSNTGIALIKLGVETGLMGKVGDDQLGNVVVSIMEKYTKDARHMVRVGESTSYTVVVAPPGADRVFLHHPGCNDTFGLEDLHMEVLRKVRLMHLGYPTLMRRLYEDGGSELIRLLKAVKEVRATVSLDVAMPDPDSNSGKQDWEKILRSSLPYVDIFLPSLEESLIMLDEARFKRFDSLGKEEKARAVPELARWLARTFMDYGTPIVGIKCGIYGYYLRTAERIDPLRVGRGAPKDLQNWQAREMWSPAYRSDSFASTTGAGDCSIAGFLAALLRGHSLETAAKCACAVGAQNIRSLDATGGVGSWDETMEMVEGDWERLPVYLDDSWSFDRQSGVWERASR